MFFTKERRMEIILIKIGTGIYLASVVFMFVNMVTPAGPGSRSGHRRHFYAMAAITGGAVMTIAGLVLLGVRCLSYF